MKKPFFLLCLSLWGTHSLSADIVGVECCDGSVVYNQVLSREVVLENGWDHDFYNQMIQDVVDRSCPLNCWTSYTVIKLPPQLDWTGDWQPIPPNKDSQETLKEIKQDNKNLHS
jgi:hypothetical protein